MSKAIRTSNKDVRQYVNNLEEFVGSNMFSHWHSWDEGMTKLYVVYSYGMHFPMYVYDDNENVWVGNKDKYSRSTTRHQSQARPSEIDVWLNTDELVRLVNQQGLLGYTIFKAQH